jgi:putative acetyltransferase
VNEQPGGPTRFGVRAERADDQAVIHALHTAAFGGPAEADLVDALRGAGRLDISLVGTNPAREVVGHVAFSSATLSGAANGLGMAPVAVREDTRCQGLAAALIRAGLAAAEEGGCGWVVVLGSPAYYGRFGFKAASTRVLLDEFGGGDAFMVLECREGALPEAGGLVRYAPEFDVWKPDAS